MKIVIVGNGAAGNSAAFTTRKLCQEADISMFSVDTLPEYSPCILADYIAGSVSRQQVFLKSLTDYQQHNIRAFFGEKVFQIDPPAKKVWSEKGVVPYDALVIATGSSPVIPKIPGFDKQGVFTLKSLQDADAILKYPGKVVVVVGSGPVGTHASVGLREKGFTVYLIELLDHILPTIFDEKPSLLIRDVLQNHGITALPGERVVEILGNDRVSGVLTDKRSIECDKVILSVGMKLNVDLATGASLELGELGGIKVDKHMMTSEENIYACGDCVETESRITGRPTLSLLWPSAIMQGIVAAHNCIGMPRNYPGPLDVVGINLPDFHAVSMGVTSSALDNDAVEIVERNYPSHYYRLLISNNMLVGAQFINRTRYSGAILNAVYKKSSPHDIQCIIDQRRLPLIASKVIPTNY